MRSFARIALVNLGLIAAVVAAAEIVFGTWVFGPDYGMLNIPRDERRVFDVSEFIPGYGPVVYSRDAYGFRGNSNARPEQIGVVVLGGSTTNERFISDQDTWVARLERNFRSADKPVRFANASLDGQTTIGHIAAVDLWLTKIPGFNPRYALIYVGINDMTVQNHDLHQFDAMMSPDPSRRLRQYLINHSALYNLFRTVRGTLAANRANLMHGTAFLASSHWVPVREFEDPASLRASLAVPLQNYSERLAILTERLRTIGAAPIFVTQTRGDYKMVDGTLHQLIARKADPRSTSNQSLAMLQLFNDATLAHCARYSLVCVDLGGAIELTDGDFYDRLHTTPAGSAKIADFLYGELKDVLAPRP
jgi:lysophospholipase L1-like esterase